MYDTVIPIGNACNISWLMENAKFKKQTTLFEWFVSPNLKDITDVLIKIVNNQDDNILKQTGIHVRIGSNIYSSHYKLKDFKLIYKRRRDRLLESIILSKRIVFCRFESKSIEYSKEDIDNFINAVLMINKNLLEIKLLLITPCLELEHPAVTKVFFDNFGTDQFCRTKEVNDLFVNTLIKIGYNINDTTDVCFNDKSDF